MAPIALDTGSPADPVQSLKIRAKTADPAIFPDGLKTSGTRLPTPRASIQTSNVPNASAHHQSGQHPPLYDQIRPYRAFPKHIEGPTVWRAEDYANNPERWVHQLSAPEIEEISRVADNFIASGLPITGITKQNFPLPSLESNLAAMRRELVNGKGFMLFKKSIPVNEWGNFKSAVAYFGLGVHIGYPVSQNRNGHILGHVQSLDVDGTKIDSVRIYKTTARQAFHADECDIVGLLCLARAQSGGESDVASIHHVWNILQAERPDVAELLTQPVWYFDRKGEVSAGEEPYIRGAVFYLETPDPANPERKQRVYCKWDPYYVRSLQRFSDLGIIPPLSAAQEEAANLLEATCERVKLHMILEVGDIQFVANSHTLHARTAYVDHPPASGLPRRHLMRLWLSVPQGEGGWRLPYWDADEKKRGGIQVDDTAPVARLEGD